MTPIEFFQTYWEDGLLYLILGAGIIQISPIKIDPFTWIAKRIGNVMNSDLKVDIDKISQKVDMVEQQLEIHRKENSQERADDCRTRILKFNDEVTEQKLHTKEHYDNILEDIDRYESYCKANPDYPNNKAVLAIHNIKNAYEKHLADGSFKVVGVKNEERDN